MSKILLILFLVMAPTSLAPGFKTTELVIWNVGQGLWVTYIANGVCHHFDMGGEKTKATFLKTNLKRHCSDKANFAYFSHWDWDHISLATMAKSWLPNLCIKSWPQGPPSFKKKAYLSLLGQCFDSTIPPAIREIQIPIRSSLKPNQLSRVFVINDEILLPGDSPVDMEKKWREKISQRNQIRILVLGHHGSRTSTSRETLNRLPNLTAGISSSTPKKYGHPHSEVLRRLKTSHVPILKTVTWNSLHFLLKEPRLRTSYTTKH